MVKKIRTATTVPCEELATKLKEVKERVGEKLKTHGPKPRPRPVTFKEITLKVQSGQKCGKNSNVQTYINPTEKVKMQQYDWIDQRAAEHYRQWGVRNRIDVDKVKELAARVNAGINSTGRQSEPRIRYLGVTDTKTPKRKYLTKTLKTKRDQARHLYNQILELAEGLPSAQQKFVIEAARTTLADIRNFVELRLEVGPHLVKFKIIAIAVKASVKFRQIIKKSNMETVKLVATLVPQYDGREDRLDSTISALRALDTIITDVTRPIAIQVILSRLDGKARSAVPANPGTIGEIITGLENKCKIKQKPESVIAKLNATRQTGTIVEFATKIEKLTEELEKTYIAEEVPLASATRLASSAAVKALTNGVKNSEIKLIMKAGQFETLNAAITRVTELDADESQQKAIFWNSRYSRGGNSNYRGRGNNRGRGSYNRYQNYDRNNNQNQNWNRNEGHGYNQNGYHGNRNRGRGRGGAGNNVYVAQHQQPSQEQPQRQSQQEHQRQPQQNQNQQVSSNNPFLGVPFGNTQQRTQ